MGWLRPCKAALNMAQQLMHTRRNTLMASSRPLACGALLGLACLLATPTWAWNPFAAGPRFQEPELTAAEWRQVDQKAGWAADSDTTLLIEISNKLPGPLACHGFVVTLQNGTEVKKAFSPYLYVPAAATKQAGINGVKKGSMKGFNLSCNCWKREGDARCSDPKKTP